ncbi:ASCH domain-containing protein [Oceanobacillus sp. CAU 1775]
MEEKTKLPPKTGELDKLVTKSADIEKVLKGKKTATRRSGRFADVGDTWSLEGKELIVKNVYRQKLGEVTDEDAVMEGYQNLEGYKDSILSLHPGMKWQTEMKVWVHEFELVNN